MEHKQEPGIFWLSSDPENFLAGHITLNDAGGTILTTAGRWGQYYDSGYSKQEVIHGMVGNSHIKLVNCAAVDHQSRGFGLLFDSDTTWHCQFAFRGNEYSGNIPNNIESVDIRVELLSDYISGLDLIKQGDDRKSLSWPYERKDTTANWDLGTVRIHQEIWPGSGAPQYQDSTTTVRTFTTVRIIFSQPQSWESVVSIVSCMQALVSIAKGAAIQIEWVSVVERGTPDVRLSASYDRVLHRVGNPNRSADLFTGEEFDGVDGIAKWLNAFHDQETILNLLLLDRYREPSFLTDRTAHLLKSCKAYQRSVMANPNQAINNLQTQVLDPMLAKAGTLFRRWLGNEQTWKDNACAGRNSVVFAPIRDYGTGSSQPDYNLINEQLYVMIVLCLLEDCGISPIFSNNVVNRAKS